MTGVPLEQAEGHQGGQTGTGAVQLGVVVVEHPAQGTVVVVDHPATEVVQLGVVAVDRSATEEGKAKQAGVAEGLTPEMVEAFQVTLEAGTLLQASR